MVEGLEKFIVQSLGSLAVPTIIIILLLRFAEARVWPLIVSLSDRMMSEMKEMAALLARISERVDRVEREIERHRQILDQIGKRQ